MFQCYPKRRRYYYHIGLVYMQNNLLKARHRHYYVRLSQKEVFSPLQLFMVERNSSLIYPPIYVNLSEDRGFDVYSFHSSITFVR